MTMVTLSKRREGWVFHIAGPVSRVAVGRRLSMVARWRHHVFDVVGPGTETWRSVVTMGECRAQNHSNETPC